MTGRAPERLPLQRPAGVRANWWAIAVYRADGALVEARNLIVPEQRLGDAIIAARAVMIELAQPEVVIYGEPPGQSVLYQERDGVVLVNRIGA